MKKYIILTSLSLICCACDQKTQCNTDTASKFLLDFNGLHLYSQNTNAINTMKQNIESVKSTGYKSEFYGTTICEVVLKGTGPNGLCYVYDPQTKTYTDFKCPKKK